jgi:phosphoglucosamine mutase
MCAIDLKKRNKLTQNAMVTTVMSNIGLDRCLSKEGIKVVRTQVGDRYVVEAMKKEAIRFGGEASGHLIFLDHATTGDGMVAAMSILTMMTLEKKPLSELQTLYEPFPQTLLNIDVPKKVPFDELDDVQNLISAISQKYGENGRVLVRYSGTEMKVRVMVEGMEATEVEQDADAIAQELLSALQNH